MESYEFEKKELEIALDENESEFNDLLEKIGAYFVKAKGSDDDRKAYFQLSRELDMQQMDNQ